MKFNLKVFLKKYLNQFDLVVDNIFNFSNFLPDLALHNMEQVSILFPISETF